MPDMEKGWKVGDLGGQADCGNGCCQPSKLSTVSVHNVMLAGLSGWIRGLPGVGLPHLSVTERSDPALQHCHQCGEGTLGLTMGRLGGRSLGGT